MESASADHIAISAEELSLWKQFHEEDDQRARGELIARYSDLVRKIAGAIYRTANFGYVEFRDLVQLGTVGLLEAISRYDYRLGVGFAHYAGSRIRGAILNGLEQQSEYHAQLAFRRRVREDRTTSLLDFSKKSESPDAFIEMVDLALGLAIGHMLEGTALYVDPEDASTSYPDASEATFSSSAIHGLLGQLPEVDRKIVELHYVHGVSFTEVAKLMGLTKGRISQLHARAMRSIREAYHRKGGVNLLV